MVVKISRRVSFVNSPSPTLDEVSVVLDEVFLEEAADDDDVDVVDDDDGAVVATAVVDFFSSSSSFRRDIIGNILWVSKEKKAN